MTLVTTATSAFKSKLNPWTINFQTQAEGYMTKELTIREDEKQSSTIQEALIQVVQRTDIDPDRLEKFLDLQIKMENRQAEAALNEALANFQAECPIIPKTKKAHNSNYAPYDEIKHIVKPIAHKYGLSWSFTVNDKSDAEKEMIVTIRHKQGAQFQSRYSFPSMDDGGKMNSSQRTKSSNSYAKRAALENALDIASTEMDDDARRAIDVGATEEQISLIKALMEQTDVTNEMFFKKYLVNSFSELSAHDAKKAILALKTRKSACIK
jgi:hypothetical protein